MLGLSFKSASSVWRAAIELSTR